MSQSDLKYEAITEWNRADVEKALRDDDPNALLRAVLAVSMFDEDWQYAQDLCVRLAKHRHLNVRGNAICGFGHISRVHQKLDCDVVKPIIQAALHDDDAYVRGHAHDAADDTSHFLGWHFEEDV